MDPDDRGARRHRVPSRRVHVEEQRFGHAELVHRTAVDDVPGAGRLREHLVAVSQRRVAGDLNVRGVTAGGYECERRHEQKL